VKDAGALCQQTEDPGEGQFGGVASYATAVAAPVKIAMADQGPIRGRLEAHLVERRQKQSPA